MGTSNTRVFRCLPDLSFPFCTVRARNWCPEPARLPVEDASPKMKTQPQRRRRHRETAHLQPVSQCTPAPPLPAPLPSPSPAQPLGPPFPPRLRCAMGGGQQSELRGAKQSGRCHLIPSRRREAQRSERRALVPRAPAPSDLQRVSGQGLGGSSDHPPPGQRQSLPVSTAVADLGLEGGVDQRGSGKRWSRECVGAQRLESMRRKALCPPGSGRTG